MVTAAFEDENETVTRKLLVKKAGTVWKFSGYTQ
jgi:hypothetical protein